MKLYVISHDGKPAYHKMCAWVDVDKIGSNGIYVKSIRAFLKKKEAKEWLQKKGKSFAHLKIKTATLQAKVLDK